MHVIVSIVLCNKSFLNLIELADMTMIMQYDGAVVDGRKYQRKEHLQSLVLQELDYSLHELSV